MSALDLLTSNLEEALTALTRARDASYAPNDAPASAFAAEGYQLRLRTLTGVVASEEGRLDYLLTSPNSPLAQLRDSIASVTAILEASHRAVASVPRDEQQPERQVELYRDAINRATAALGGAS